MDHEVEKKQSCSSQLLLFGVKVHIVEQRLLLAVWTEEIRRIKAHTVTHRYRGQIHCITYIHTYTTCKSNKQKMKQRQLETHREGGFISLMHSGCLFLTLLTVVETGCH